MLEIISTSYYSAEYLNFNYQLLKAHNPDLNFRWTVIQNSPEPELNLSKNFIVHPGPPRPDKNESAKIGSLHHGLALNQSIQYIEMSSRFVLFLDPDFFIIQRIQPVLDYMDKNQLEFFGAPYDNGKKKLIFGFPTAFCMFVDTNKVNLYADSFDFRAEAKDDEVTPYYTDVGYKIYSHFKPMSKYDIVLTNKKANKSVQGLYKLIVPDPTSQYFWNDKAWGLHTRMKMHCHDEAGRKNRTLYQVKTIRKIIREIRRVDQC